MRFDNDGMIWIIVFFSKLKISSALHKYCIEADNFKSWIYWLPTLSTFPIDLYSTLFFQSSWDIYNVLNVTTPVLNVTRLLNVTRCIECYNECNNVCIECYNMLNLTLNSYGHFGSVVLIIWYINEAITTWAFIENKLNSKMFCSQFVFSNFVWIFVHKWRCSGCTIFSFCGFFIQNCRLES